MVTRLFRDPSYQWLSRRLSLSAETLTAELNVLVQNASRDQILSLNPFQIKNSVRSTECNSHSRSRAVPKSQANNIIPCQTTQSMGRDLSQNAMTLSFFFFLFFSF